MTKATSLSKRQAMLWLWRKDPEAKWFWLRQYLKGCDLRPAVLDNLNYFGLVKRC